MVLGEVELAAGIPEGIVVSGTGEVEPFWVAELVAFEVEVALSSQAVGDQSDHLVQGHASFDGGCEFGQHGHVGVHFLVAEPHHERFITDQAGEVSFYGLSLQIIGRGLTLDHGFLHMQLSSRHDVCWSG